MRMIFLFNFLLFYCVTVAQSLKLGVRFQPSKANILFFKINKITIRNTENNNKSYNYYFDKNGNDTALYIDGVLSWRKKYEKDKQGKIIRWIQYYSNRLEQFRAVYTYEKDGSYTITYTDNRYQAISQSETYDKHGKIQSEFLLDGGQHIHKYDSLGRLSRIDSEPGLDGYDQFSAEYIYDASSILISIKTSYLGYEYLEEYAYDDKGILIKSVSTLTYHHKNEKEISTTSYSYVFR